MSAFTALAALCALGIASPASAQMVNSAATVRKGQDLAAIACATCHKVAGDRRTAPILPTPAPSFDTIAQRPDIDAGILENFITTTGRNAEHPSAMPNPYLLDYQVQQIVTYILSLRK
jgi:mono/diheme cytochrome c family protein